jgi:hypothetical protein
MCFSSLGVGAVLPFSDLDFAEGGGIIKVDVRKSAG